MLVIFDLDDTLVDTSGSIVPGLLKKALFKMEKVGLPIVNFDETYKFIKRLNNNHLTTSLALREFIELTGAPPECYEMGMNEIYHQPTFEDPITPVDYAVEVLEELALSHQLVLVTSGKESIQLEKMKKAGIEVSLFSKLYFCDGNKKKIYNTLAKETGISPLNIIVCGDRISFDLTPAKELGFKTVHMRWGRGLGNTGLKNDVDYTILNLNELKQILNDLNNV